MRLEIQLCYHRNKPHFKIKRVILIITFYNITVLLSFLSNKCNLGPHVILTSSDCYLMGGNGAVNRIRHFWSSWEDGQKT